MKTTFEDFSGLPGLCFKYVMFDNVSRLMGYSNISKKEATKDLERKIKLCEELIAKILDLGDYETDVVIHSCETIINSYEK